MTEETTVKPKHISGAEFDAQVLQNKTPAVVDLWASWCGPCHMMAPILDEIATDYAGKLDVFKVQLDDEDPAAQAANQELASKFGVMSIPTLLFFRNGQKVGEFVGATTKDVLAQKVDEILAAPEPEAPAE